MRPRIVPQPIVHGLPQCRAVLMLPTGSYLARQRVSLAVPHHPPLFLSCQGTDGVDGDVDVIVARIAVDGKQTVVALQESASKSTSFLQQIGHGHLLAICRWVAQDVLVALAVSAFVVLAALQIGTTAGGSPVLGRSFLAFGGQVQDGAVIPRLQQTVGIQKRFIVPGPTVLPMLAGIVFQDILVAGVFRASMLDDSHRRSSPPALQSAWQFAPPDGQFAAVPPTLSGAASSVLHWGG